MVKYKEKPEKEIAFDKGIYKNQDLEDLYELDVRRDERPLLEQEELPEERIVKEFVQKKRATPQLVEPVIQPLNLLGTEVLGSLFDRVEFLKTRIQEVTDSIKLRDSIHKDMATEVEEDIREKEGMVLKVANLDDKRDIKLDITALRREKRLETVQYWRDLVELKTELRELLERHETESKIANIFREISPEAAKEEER